MKQDIQHPSPHQNLISTIYKQSWYPVTSSTKENRKKSDEHEGHRNAGNLRRDGSPFQQLRSTSTRSQRHKTNRSSEPARTSQQPIRNGSRSVEIRSQNHTPPYRHMHNLLPAETEISSFDVNNSQGTEQCNQMSPTLASWRRRLKTCVKSRAKQDVQISTPATPNISLMSRQHSWSNVTSPKSYRVLNYPNHTLAAMCLQGKAPSVQPRPASARCEKRTRCNSFPCSGEPKYVKTQREQNILSKSEFVEFQTEEYKDEIPESSNLENVVTENETFCEETDELNLAASISLDADEKAALNDYKTDNAFDSDDQALSGHSGTYDSDLSESEISSNDDDGAISMCSEDGAFEQSRCDKYKQLYMNENQPQSCKNEIEESFAVLNAFDEFSIESEMCTRDEYLFADVLPAAFDENTLHELSILPFDVDWRAVVSVADSLPLPGKKGARRKNTKAANVKREKILQHRADVESVVDRLLVFERLQTTTAQHELERKLHSAHLKSKPKHTVTKSVSAQSDSKIPESNSAVKNTWARRRSSIPNFNARLAWATEARLNEDGLLKRACKDGDLTILHDNWLACCKDRASGKTDANRAKDAATQKATDHASGSNLKRPKSARNRARCYDYYLSERTKDEKRRRYSVSNTAPFMCTLCRERARRLIAAKYVAKGTLEPRRYVSTTRSNTVYSVAQSEKLSQTTPRPTTVRTTTVTSSTLPIKPMTANPSVVSPLLWKSCNDSAKKTTQILTKEYAYVAQCSNSSKFVRSQARSPKTPVSGLVHMLSSAVKISAVSVSTDKKT